MANRNRTNNDIQNINKKINIEQHEPHWTNENRVRSLYITTCSHAWACSFYSHFLQGHDISSTKLLNQGCLKNRPILSFKTFFVFPEDINTLLKSIMSVAHRWYWQLDFGSKLTIVSLLCLTMALHTNI